MRLALTLAALLSAAAPAAMAQGLTDMSEADRAAFNEAVREFLLENPEVIVEAMTVLQSREDQAAVQRDLDMLAENKDLIFNSSDDWAGGNLEGDITLVEFMDYRCGYCHKAYEEVEELIKSDGKIRFVLKEFPVLGPDSITAAKFAISVRKLYGDDAYKTAHDAMFAMRGEINAQSLARLAETLGHDPKAVETQMNAPEVQAVIDQNYELAQKMEVNGTPAFVIGNMMLRGYIPLDSMRQIVEQARDKG